VRARRNAICVDVARGRGVEGGRTWQHELSCDVVHRDVLLALGVDEGVPCVRLEERAKEEEHVTQAHARVLWANGFGADAMRLEPRRTERRGCVGEHVRMVVEDLGEGTPRLVVCRASVRRVRAGWRAVRARPMLVGMLRFGGRVEHGI
jgi:hypothetical protein